MKNFFYCTAGIFFLLLSLQIVAGLGLLIGGIVGNWDVINQAMNMVGM